VWRVFYPYQWAPHREPRRQGGKEVVGTEVGGGGEECGGSEGDGGKGVLRGELLLL